MLSKPSFALMIATLIAASPGTHAAAADTETQDDASSTEREASAEQPRDSGSPAKSVSDAESMDEVIVRGRSFKPLTEIDPDTEQLLNVAGAGVDPLSAILSLPGVTFASDYSSEPAVRGSAPDDNGYYVDMIPARYIFHLFGNSIFNHNLIHSFDLYPAAFASHYSNATGAIIDVKLRDPRAEPLATTVDVSFLSAGLLVESGLGEDQAFFLSYRRSLLDQFVRDPEDLEDDDSGVSVEQIPVADDYQFKHRWELNDQNRITLLAAGASDKVGATFRQNSNIAMRDPDFIGAAEVSTAFDSQGISWERLSDSGDQATNILLTRSIERDDISYGTGQFLDVETERQMLRGQWAFDLGESHQWLLGGWLEETDYDLQLNAKLPACTDFDPDCPTIDAPLIQFNDGVALESQVLFLEDRWQISDSLLLSTGVHYLTDDSLDQEHTEPRLRMEWQASDNWRFHAAYGHYSQLPEADEIAPAVGNPQLDYIESIHSVLGVQQDFGEQWSWMVELYHKDMDKLPLSLSPLRDADFADRYSNDASGKAYGVELFINKKLTDKFYGWLALSLSQTERHNERTGETRDFDYDKPIILNWVMNFKPTDNWLFGLKWSLQSGALYTPIVDLRNNSNNPSVVEPVYGELNSERLPFYHRLDLRAEYARPTGYGMWSLFVDVLNAYNARNVQGYSFAPNENDTIGSTPDGYGTNVPLTRAEGLGFFPSVGFKIQF